MLASDARKITVTAHATQAYRDRLADDRSLRELESEIAELVRCGNESGTIFNHKPEGFVLYKGRNTIPPGQRVIYCGDEPRVAFVVKRFPFEDVVMTTLVRVGVSR